MQPSNRRPVRRPIPHRHHPVRQPRPHHRHQHIGPALRHRIASRAECQLRVVVHDRQRRVLRPKHHRVGRRHRRRQPQRHRLIRHPVALHQKIIIHRHQQVRPHLARQQRHHHVCRQVVRRIRCAHPGHRRKRKHHRRVRRPRPRHAHHRAAPSLRHRERVRRETHQTVVVHQAQHRVGDPRHRPASDPAQPQVHRPRRIRHHVIHQRHHKRPRGDVATGPGERAVGAEVVRPGHGGPSGNGGEVHRHRTTATIGPHHGDDRAAHLFGKREAGRFKADLTRAKLIINDCQRGIGQTVQDNGRSQCEVGRVGQGQIHD